MIVLVSRAAGDKLAPETLVDVLCNSQNIGVEKGKSYLYDQGFNKKPYEVTLPYRRPIYPSQLAAVHGGSIGASFVGRVTSHNINITQIEGAISVESAVIIERSEELI